MRLKEILNSKFDYYGRPIKALKAYMYILLPLIILRSLLVVATSFPLSGTEGIVIFVVNIVFIALATASFVSLWWLNGISQGLNLAFLVYAMITSITVKVYSAYQSSLQAPADVKSSGVAEVDLVTGSILSGLNAFTGFVLFLDILFTIIWVVFCIAYIACFLKHTNLFYISEKDMEKE